MALIVVEKIFAVPCWDEHMRQKATTYWSGKRFKFFQTSDTELLAKRGRWLGNLISADLTYMKSVLTITATGERVSTHLEINPRFQKISEWDKTWWDLEMQIFESLLLNGDSQSEKWEQFKRDHKAALLQWSFSGGNNPTLLEMSSEDTERYQ